MILILIKNNMYFTVTIELNGMSMPFSEESCKQQVAKINLRGSKKFLQHLRYLLFKLFI